MRGEAIIEDKVDERRSPTFSTPNLVQTPMSAIHGRGWSHAERTGAICADVLDAWFDPAPAATKAFREASLNASPDPNCQPLAEAIAQYRNFPQNAITLGAGSSEIIHRVLPLFAQKGPTVLIDPTYSEYPFLIHDKRTVLARQECDFQVDLEAILSLAKGAALVVLVNPNNPTGTILTRAQILDLREKLSDETVLWVDEAYVDYARENVSVERDAATTKGLFVLKSLSKAYALSGVRAAYLVCHPDEAAQIQTPPWIIGTAAQAAAIAALESSAYYEARWRESNALVHEFAAKLREGGFKVWSGAINAVLVECPEGLTATEWACRLARAKVMVRTPQGMGDSLGEQFIRIGLVDPAHWPVIFRSLKETLA